MDAELADWCRSILGDFTVDSEQTRAHPGERSGVWRLETGGGSYFLKAQRDLGHWHSEAHAYQNWTGAFGAHAPRLLGVRAEEPRAVLVSALAGRILEGQNLGAAQEREIWRSAGRALALFHAQARGTFFGPCRQDGSSLGAEVTEAVAYVGAEFEGWLEGGLRGGFLTAGEQALLREARGLLPAFAGEPPAPCHRDYGPANWVIGADGCWAGVIDFEFCYWDVRAADFARYPEWNWIQRPDLLEAFFEGYGRVLSPAEEEQVRFERILYALVAVVWGMQNEYFGFAREGHAALAHLGK